MIEICEQRLVAALKVEDAIAKTDQMLKSSDPLVLAIAVGRRQVLQELELLDKEKALSRSKQSGHA